MGIDRDVPVSRGFILCFFSRGKKLGVEYFGFFIRSFEYIRDILK